MPTSFHAAIDYNRGAPSTSEPDMPFVTASYRAIRIRAALPPSPRVAPIAIVAIIGPIATGPRSRRAAVSQPRVEVHGWVPIWDDIHGILSRAVRAD